MSGSNARVDEAEVELVPSQVTAWSEHREVATARDTGEQSDGEVWQATLSGSDDDEPTVSPLYERTLLRHTLTFVVGVIQFQFACD